MGITFLRYPGGCNADVFDWRDTVGPLDQRKEIINYHNGTGRGIARFGVDEYLRFCEEEGMVPLITTAFCKDRPEKVDPNDHPNGIRHEYVFSYLKNGPRASSACRGLGGVLQRGARHADGKAPCPRTAIRNRTASSTGRSAMNRTVPIRPVRAQRRSTPMPFRPTSGR